MFVELISLIHFKILPTNVNLHFINENLVGPTFVFRS